MNRHVYIFFTILMVSPIFNTEAKQVKKGPQWRKNAFTWIYDKHFWCKDETTPLSGVGSTLEATETLRILLPDIIKILNIETIFDAGCGDFTWMSKTDISVKQYIGADIVESVIKENKKRYENETHQFYCADIVTDEIPKVDLILCRDCLIHMSFDAIKQTIQNFKKSGATYLLVTTYPHIKINDQDIITGHFRPINLMSYPFYFPKPVMLFEELTGERDKKKWLRWIGVWCLDDIHICN